MDEAKQLKIIYWLVIAFTVVVVAPVAIYAAYIIVLRFAEQYPGIGVLGWSALAAWFISNPLLFVYLNRKCNKKAYQKNCGTRAMGLTSLYTGITIIIYVLVTDVLWKCCFLTSQPTGTPHRGFAALASPVASNLECLFLTWQPGNFILAWMTAVGR